MKKSRAELIPYVMGAAVLFQFFDAVAVATALPHIAQSLEIDLLSASWVITAYLVGMAMSVPAAGWLADAYGGTNVLRVSGMMLILAMIGCYLAPSFPILIGTRFIAGAASSLILPVARLLVIRNAKPEQLTQWVTTFALLGQIGPIAGPPFSGILIYYLGWRSVFLAMIPFAALMIISVTWVGAQEHDRSPGKLDVRGLLLCILTLMCMVTAMEMLGHHASPLVIIGLLLCGSTFLALLVRHSQSTANPLLNLALLRRPVLRASLLADFPIRMVSAACPMLISLLLQSGLHQTVLIAGIILLAPSLGTFGVKSAFRILGAKCGIPVMMAWGAWLTAFPFMALALISDERWLFLVFVLLALHGLGRAMVANGATILNFKQVTSAEMGTVTALTALSQQIALVVGLGMATVSLRLFSSGTIERSDIWPAIVIIGGVSFLCIIPIFTLARFSPKNPEPD